MAADAGTKTFTPILSEPLPSILRDRTPRAPRSRPATHPAAQKLPLDALFPATTAATAPAKRARVIVAGCRNIERTGLEALDRIAAHLTAQLFVLHESASAPVMLEQVQDLPPMKAPTARHLLSRASAFLGLTGTDADDPFLLRAAASGCALILLDTPTMRSRWEGAAAFIRMENERACAQILRRMLEDPEFRQRLALAAVRLAQPERPQRPIRNPAHPSQAGLGRTAVNASQLRAKNLA